jgi:anti-sigma regulatory factor (Ser/Thr protein kinase)
MTDRSTPAARRESAERLTLDPSPSSPARARRVIHDRAAAWSLPAAVGDQLALVGSELVTNAALHARTPFTLTLELRDDHVRISVEDQSSAPVALRHYQPDAPTGRGLGVVAMLSQAWGVQPTGDGKVVWAELDLTGERPPAAAAPQEQPRVPADGVAAASPELRAVRFVGVPVEAYLALQEHNDALFRELELIRSGWPPRVPWPGRPRRAWPAWSTSSTGSSAASATGTGRSSPRRRPVASGPSS